MVAPRPMSFTEWKASGYQTVSGQLNPPPPPPPPAYSGEYVPVSSFTPNAVPEGEYYAPAGYPELAAPPASQPQGGSMMPTNFGFGGITQEQRNAAIATVAPPTNFGYGPSPESYIAQDQQDQFYRALATDAERSRLGTAQGTVGPAADEYLAGQAATNIAEMEKQNAAPWQEKVIPGEIRNMGAANIGGAVKDAAGVVKDTIGRAGPVDALGAGLTTLAGGVMQAAQIPFQRANEVQITRKYDELTQGNPDATFGPYLPTTVLTNTVLNPVRQGAQTLTEGDRPGDYEALQNWLDDQANAQLITSLFENGYGGEQGYGAVYKYYNEQQGMAGITADVLGDPFLYAELGLGAAKSGAARLGTRAGMAGRVGRAASTGLELADAMVFDPLKLPKVGGELIDAAIPGANIVQRATGARDAMGERLLTQAGKNQKNLNIIEQNASMLEQAARTTQPTDPWLFERDAAGRVRMQTVPGGGAVPLVRDRATGVVRPVQAGDVQQAFEIARNLPHERAARIAGTPTTLEQHLNDWMALVSNPRVTGLPREIDFQFPNRGPAYQMATRYTAERMARGGQAAVDAMYTQMRGEYDAAAKRVASLKAMPVKSRPPTYKADLKRAGQGVVKAAYTADRLEAALEIAGRSDASSKLRRAELTKIRREARAIGGYSKNNLATARFASGAAAPAGGTPMRLRWSDVVDVVDDETRQFADRVMADGRSVGDMVLSTRQDLSRLSDLAKLMQTGPLSPWDQQEFAGLVKRYQHLLPDGPRLVADLNEASRQINAWTDTTVGMLTAQDARRQIGIEGGMLDKKGNPVRTGIAASDSLIGKAVRALDGIGSQYRKYQLYNPLNILRYSGLQAVGNAVTLAIGDTGALLDYTKAIAARARNRGRDTAFTPADQMLRDAGIGHSPFIKSGIKDDITLTREGVGAGPVESVLRAGRRFAGAFDISLREAAYMHRFQPKYRALQMGMKREAARRAASMGVPVNPAQLDNAFAHLDALHPRYKAWQASELKDALLRASGRPGDTAAQNWADRVARDYANGVRTLHKDALANVNRLGFSFEETKLDALLGKVFMYHYWSSRANMLYTREMLGNPALLNGYVSMWRTLDREAEKDNAPSWLRGFYAFMQTPMGLTVFANPTALLNTFAIFNPEILGEGYDGNLTGLGKARQRSPFMVNPVIDQLLFQAGLYGSGASAPNIMPISGAKLYDWLTYWNAHTDTPVWTDAKGNPVPPPMALRTFGGRAVSQFLAEKISPQTKELADRLGIPADVMQFGDMASSQRQDLVFLMMDVLREQNPGLDDTAIQDLLVDEHGGGFDTGDPVYQQALDRYAERAYAGILEGRDVPNAVRGLIDAASPFGRIPQVTSRLQNDANINSYFQAEDDQAMWADIRNGTVDEAVRVGGFKVAPPSLFTTIDLGGTVYTPEDLAALTPEERAIVADAWFQERNPGYTAGEELLFPESALRASEIARAANPDDLATQEAEDAFYHPGTPEQNEAAAFAKSIRDGQLRDEGSRITVTIDGQSRTFDNNDLARMTAEERKALAALWTAESGNGELIDGYYAARDALVSKNPDIGGYFAMKDIAGQYPGGALAWVEDAIKENPTTYGQYAERLDPNRYPPGTEDWAKKMLSLEGYQALTQQRPSSSAPFAWEDAPGAPVIPGMTGASSLPEYAALKAAEEEADQSQTPDQIVGDDLVRVSNMLAAADAYDAAQGYAPGTSRGKIIDQIVQGEYNDANKIDKALLDELKDAYPSVGKDGETYGPIPTGESFTRRYIVWALGQPEDQRDPGLWSAQDWLTSSFQESAERGLVENATGQLELAPEVTPDAPPIDFLNGLALTRGADGSGVYLTNTPAPSGVAAQPAYAVGGMGGTLYQDASVDSQPIIILGPETPLQTVESLGDWVHVVEPGGLEGWMRKGYLSSGQRTPAPVSAPTPAPTTSAAGSANAPLPVPPSQRPGGMPATPAPTATPTATPVVSPSPTPAPASNLAQTELGATFQEQGRLLAPQMPTGPAAYDPQVIQNIDTTSYVSPNRTSRNGVVPTGIVYHYTVGDLDSFTADFMGQTGRQASANYVVDRDGTIYQFVDPDDAAWTHGDVSNPRTDLPWLTNTLTTMTKYGDFRGNLNTYAIGIEIVNSGNAIDPNYEDYTPEQMAAVAQLTAYLVDRYGMTPGTDNLIGHEDVSDHKSDPGPKFDWNLIYHAAGVPGY